MAETYLSRSGVLKLDMRLKLSTQPGLLPMHPNLLAHLESQETRSRLRRLRLLVLGYDDLYDLQKFVEKAYFPCLEHFELFAEPCVESSSYSDESGSVFQGGAPSLVYVRLSCVLPTTFLPPLSSVTHLVLKEPVDVARERTSLLELSEILNGLPALTHLVLHGDYQHSDDDTLLADIELPSLLSLQTLIFGVIDMFPTVLNLIKAPALQYLLLEAMVSDEIDRYVELLRIRSSSTVSPKFPCLHTLTVIPPPGDTNFRTSSWRNMTLAFPTVEDFTISHATPDFFLKCLRTEPGESSEKVAWKQLHTLTLANSTPSDDTVSLIEDVVEDRLHNPACCRLSTLKVTASIMVSLLPQIKHFIERVELQQTAIYEDLIMGSSFITDPSNEE